MSAHTLARPVARTAALTSGKIDRQVSLRHHTEPVGVAQAVDACLSWLRVTLSDGYKDAAVTLGRTDVEYHAMRAWFSNDARVPSLRAVVTVVCRLRSRAVWDRIAAWAMACGAWLSKDETPTLADAWDAEHRAECDSDIAINRVLAEPTVQHIEVAKRRMLAQMAAGHAVLAALEKVRPMGCDHYGRA
jgi:hypothetical protein